MIRRLALWLGPAVALGCWLVSRLAAPEALPDGLTPGGLVVAGVGFWMAAWWVSEAVPIAATSLIPIAAFPLGQAVPVKQVVTGYTSPFIVLLMTGFMAALAIERWQLHRRLALHVLLLVGTSPRRLVLGMMVACALCSMWISNTAATLMMLPIALALLTRAKESAPEGSPGVARFGTALALGICYAASVGGLGTPVGTPPNLIFMEIHARTQRVPPLSFLEPLRPWLPHEDPVSFAEWMGFAMPLVVVFLPLIWWVLVKIDGGVPQELPMGSREILRDERRALGRITPDERRVGLVFLAMAGFWITRSIELQGGAWGWAPALGLERFVDDATVAVVGVLALFLMRSRTRPGARLLDWETASRIPWEVVLLFGGGVALADAFMATKLSDFIVRELTVLEGLPPVVLVLAIALAVTFLTEVTSNTAIATLLMPLLASFAIGAGLPGRLVMVPAALSASCAFMLPVATAPNAIVYGTGWVTVAQMARRGLWVNLIGAVLITLWCWLVFSD